VLRQRRDRNHKTETATAEAVSNFHQFVGQCKNIHNENTVVRTRDAPKADASSHPTQIDQSFTLCRLECMQHFISTSESRAVEIFYPPFLNRCIHRPAVRGCPPTASLRAYTNTCTQYKAYKQCRMYQHVKKFKQRIYPS
jgi:hypothetical protein